MPVELTDADLPADLRELASQLSADADHLSELYPARLERDLPVERAVGEPDRMIVAGPWRWLKSASRVAAAVGLLAGLTLVVALSSAWRGMLIGQPGGGPDKAAVPMSVAESGSAAGPAPAEAAGAARPVFISAEALRLSGEEMEIVRHATQGEAVEVDI